MLGILDDNYRTLWVIYVFWRNSFYVNTLSVVRLSPHDQLLRASIQRCSAWVLQYNQKGILQITKITHKVLNSMLVLELTIQRYKQRDPGFSRILELLRAFPITWRKIVIKSCQLGHVTPSIERDFLQAAQIRPLASHVAFRHDHFLAMLQPVLYSPVKRSLLWIYARTIPEPSDNDEYLDVVEATFFKEFRAATTVFSHYQLYQYGDFLLDTPIERPTAPAFAQSVRNIVETFSWKLRRIGILYPNVQRVKNISMESGIQYSIYNPGSDPRSVTSRDLEVHYGRTGFQIQGGCELRESWKFNDLKPRLYYCQGGRDYFASRYTKRIAVLLLESIQTTRYSRRIDPTKELSAELAEWITAWDLSSFTTNLSELKFFLYWLARGLEERNLEDIEIFDYHKGQVFVPIHELLDVYNETVNVHSPFSIHRIIDKFAFAQDFEVEEYSQSNSGMLGVAGNIGFSMANHGTVIEMNFGPDKSSCVGDDAFTIHADHPEQEVIPTVKHLGDIQYEKFESLEPGDQGPLRYLKRALYRNPDSSLYLDYLLVLPIPNYADGELGHRTEPANFDWINRIKKISIQTGQLFWDLYSLDSYEKDRVEMVDLLKYLSVLYNMLQMPKGGALPGAKIRLPGGQVLTIGFAIPSLKVSEYDPRYVDWLEFQFTRHQEAYDLPVYCQRSHKPKCPEPGDVVYSGIAPLWTALEDLGYVETERLTERVFFLDESNRRRLRKKLGREVDSHVRMVEIRCCRYIPDTFLPFFSDPDHVYLDVDFET